MNDVATIVYDDTHRLAVYRPDGVLDKRLASLLLDFVMALEKANPEPFSRLLDLSAVGEIRLTGQEVFQIAQARRATTVNRPPFRTAILAPTPIAYGTGRMYELLMEGSAVVVGVFRDSAAAAEWLGLPAAVVRPSGP